MKAVAVILGVILVVIGLTFGLGYLGVGYTKTVDKAQVNAEREVFKSTTVYVEGKQQELVKMHHEWKEYERKDDKAGMKAIEFTIRQDFTPNDLEQLRNSGSELSGWLADILNN